MIRTLVLVFLFGGCATTTIPLERDLAELRATPGPMRCIQQGWVTTCAR